MNPSSDGHEVPTGPGASQTSVPTGLGASQTSVPTGPGASQSAVPTGPGASQSAVPTEPGASQSSVPTEPGTSQSSVPTGPGVMHGWPFPLPHMNPWQWPTSSFPFPFHMMQLFPGQLVPGLPMVNQPAVAPKSQPAEPEPEMEAPCEAVGEDDETHETVLCEDPETGDGPEATMPSSSGLMNEKSYVDDESKDNDDVDKSWVCSWKRESWTDDSWRGSRDEHGYWTWEQYEEDWDRYEAEWENYEREWGDYERKWEDYGRDPEDYEIYEMEWGTWKPDEPQAISEEEEEKIVRPLTVFSETPTLMKIKPKKRPAPSPPATPPPAHLLKTDESLPPLPAPVIPPPKKKKKSSTAEGNGDPLPPGPVQPQKKEPRVIPPRYRAGSYVETDGVTEVRSTWSVRKHGDRDMEIAMKQIEELDQMYGNKNVKKEEQK